MLDVGAGTSEEIAELWPEADEYVFLDSFSWPPERPRYRLLRQSAGEPLPLPDDYLDLVTSNGSFDHFTDAERLAAFHEIERCLRPGGMFLFACEYFDFDPADEQAFFHRCATHPDAVAMNCPAFSNIKLRAHLRRASRRCGRCRTIARGPPGRPAAARLRQPGSTPATSDRIRQRSTAYWGSFFVAFEKQG